MAIGGYFQLELCENKPFQYSDLILLNTARNCLEYILRAKGYKKIYIPYFTCDVLLEPINKLNIDYQFYDIDDSLEPIFDYDRVGGNEVFLATNYFGIKTKFIEDLSSKVKNLIIDNAQAFFAKPLLGIDTFYSPRKFVGVSDGGILATKKILEGYLEKDFSYERMSHLLKRIDLSAEEGYNDFVLNDKVLEKQNIKLMSNLTKSILSNIDFERIKKLRRENYLFLDKYLKKDNLLNIELDQKDIPMIYPYRVKSAKKIRDTLISQKIYCATYWPNVLDWSAPSTNSYNVTKGIIALPIDQRYNINHMTKIINLISKK
ncbi:hypothetical protein [Elizabethkingia anophelis]|uniref:DegT/DnrJ/EryC1/StrS aminotransferase family protein n=1 Tax=Elizabethkingia anophelis TaxID=1117645 RepID=A0AAE4P2P9_9FLAO|nr:hypothetical protein [Elizabethkingia anophelis]MCT4124383.1 hypothetical protein [Elizabethkingia anophelis]MDV3665892.1 hypothetical protein [Elizabethkingia anophelis]MYY43788.1 hypothetical protein [Elizabethkingia anophelis]